MVRTELEALIDDPTPFLRDKDPSIRRLAVSACAARLGEDGVILALTTTLDSDDDPRVRAEAAEVLAIAGQEVQDSLLRHTAANDPVVREAVATGLGEMGSVDAVPWLIETAGSSDDRLVQEAAVAALGAIGDERAVPQLLYLAGSGPPQVRRRAVVALTAFDGPQAGAAIESAASDRNPMVREVAEMLLGRRTDGGPG